MNPFTAASRGHDTNPQNTRDNVSATVKYQHTNGHMDKYLIWHHLSLEQKMNVICNGFTKHVLARATKTGTKREVKQLILGEDATVSVNSKKLTRDLGKAVQYEVRKEQARDHLISNKGWTNKEFDEVDQDRLHSAMEKS